MPDLTLGRGIAVVTHSRMEHSACTYTFQSLIRITQEKVCEADFENGSTRIYNVAGAVTFIAPHSLHNSGNLFALGK